MGQLAGGKAGQAANQNGDSSSASVVSQAGPLSGGSFNLKGGTIYGQVNGGNGGIGAGGGKGENANSATMASGGDGGEGIVVIQYIP